MQDIISRELLPGGEKRLMEMDPGDGDKGGGKIELIGLGAALGGGYGAHLVLEAGTTSAAGPITVYAAGFAGVGAAAMAGWGVGTFIGEIPYVRQHLLWMVESTANKPDYFDPMSVFVKPPPFPESQWRFDPGPQSTPVDMWWYVPEIADRVAGNGDTAYSSPFEAMSNAGISDQDWAGDGGGNSVIALLGIYPDLT